MTDPSTTIVAMNVATQSLALAKVLTQLTAEQKQKKRGSSPTTLSAFIGALPGAAQNAADEITLRIYTLRQDCESKGLVLGDLISRQSSLLDRPGKRLVKDFPALVDQIAMQISIFFDDVAAIARCSAHMIPNNVKAPNVKKKELRAGLSSSHTINEILEALNTHVDETRQELARMQGCT